MASYFLAIQKQKIVIPRLDRGIQMYNWMPDQVRHDLVSLLDCRVISIIPTSDFGLTSFHSFTFPDAEAG